MVIRALLLAALASLPMPASEDTSATDAWRVEDTLDEAADEGAFVRDDPEALDAAIGLATRGLLRLEGTGARVLFATLEAARTNARVRGQVLLAREAGEPRPIDDAYASLLVRRTGARPGSRVSARLGWFEPRAGAGLLLGPRRVSAAAPSFASKWAGFDGALSTVPASAAAGHRGLAVEIERGALRLGTLAAWTPREARPSGRAAWPVLGARHRNADEDARRGFLDERTLALAARVSPTGATWHAWAIVLGAGTGPRRAPHDGTTAAAESAAAIVTGGPAAEMGAGWRARDGQAALEGALAFDDRGRTRTRVVVEACGPFTRAGLVVESEARGFVPPRALPERRPHAHAGVVIERRLDAGRAAGAALVVEAHVVERGLLERPRRWIALTALMPPHLRFAVRHDGEPRATRLAVRLDAPGGRARAGVETRFDTRGLDRRAAWVQAVAGLPARCGLAVEARLAGGRSGAAWLDDDVSGGRLVRPGRSAARTRFTLSGPASPVQPRLDWVRTTTPDRRSDEVRLALHWTAGFHPGGGRP